MAKTKTVTYGYTTGSTLYAIIRRESDEYFFDSDDGAFVSTLAGATDPYCDMAEDAEALGLYSYSTSATVWSDGLYTVTVYSQAGVNPDTSADTVLGTGSMRIVGDQAAASEGSVSLHEYALCSLAEMKAERGVTVEDDDDRMRLAINAATDFCESYTNRKLKRRSAAVTEYHDRQKPWDDDELWPDEWPLESDCLTSIYADPSRNYTTGELTSYAIIVKQRYFKLTAGAFAEGVNANRIIYEPGYTTPPSDLKKACILIAWDLFDAQRRVTSSADTVAGFSETYQTSAINGTAMELLKPYVRGFREIGPAAGWKR